MYALFKAFDEMFKQGIYHRRKSGEIVRKFKKEDADYVVKDKLINIGDLEIRGVEYCYVFEFEEGDVITSTIFGKESTRSLIELSFNFLKPCDIEGFFVSFTEQGKKANEKYENVLREALPKVFYEDTELLCRDDFLYLINFLDYVNYTGKSLKDFVDEDDIEDYMFHMIHTYRLTVVEKYLKQENVPVSEDFSEQFNKAKLQLEKIKELAIQKVKNEEVYTYSRSEGLHSHFTFERLDAIVHVIFLSGKFWVILHIKCQESWFPMFITEYDITEECKEFESLYEKYKKMLND